MQLDTDTAADRKRCSSWHTVPLDFWVPPRAAAQAVSLCRKALAWSIMREPMPKGKV